MIEIICENEEKNEEDMPVVRRSIKIPKNVKQIGEPPQERRIYIEDYVYTYITSISGESGMYGVGSTSAVFYGLLLGETRKTSQETCLFIRSAVRYISPKEDEDIVGMNEEDAEETREDSREEISFSQEVWTSLYDAVEKYFKGQEIVGWFLCADSGSIVADSENQTLAPWVQKMHFDNFAGAAKAFFMVDPNIHEEYFYMVENGKLARQGGFICFYERNEAMQEYMLATRPPKSVDNNVDDSVIHNFRTIIQGRKEEAVKHQSISVMYGVCAFMVVVVTVIGINMMNSYQKMKTLDNSMDKIAKEIANMNAGAENFTSGENTPVIKIDGNVYPTEAATNTTPTPAETVNATVSASHSETAPENIQTNPVQTTAPTQAATTPAAETAAAPAPKKYIVEKGDTLMSICKKAYGDSLRYKDVMELNKLDNPDKLLIGQELLLP